jgi:hypothetical protein
MGFSQKKSAYLISPITATCKVISTKQSFAHETLYANHAQIPQVVNNKTANTQPAETTKQIAESIKDLAKKEANRYYIALLFKTKKLNSKKIFEYDLYNCFFGYNTTNIAQENSEEELQIKSKEHDKIFEQFAMQ